MFQEKILFTIGQFAAMHGINKKTLMWYDEVGIFKPTLIKENGYRYYSYSQSPTLETILLLRELDVPLNKIKDFLNTSSEQILMKLLDEQLMEIDRNISRFKSMRKCLVEQKDDVSMLLDLDLSEIRIVEEEPEHFTIIRISKDISWEKQVEMITEESKKCNLHNMYETSSGYMISTDSLYQNEFDNYYALFIKVPASYSSENIYIKPRGKYLHAYCKGDFDKVILRYQELLNFARENNITFAGYAYEKSINEIVTGLSDMDKFITQISIPIKTEK